MNRYFLVGALSLATGLAMAAWYSARELPHRAVAQERTPRIPAEPALRGGAKRPGAGVASERPLPDSNPVAVPRNDPPDQSGFTPEERVNIAVYDRNDRSVVNITTRAVRADVFMMFDVPTEGAGSGSVLDQEGRILTNYHVIEGAQKISVTLFNGASFEAGLVGQDPDNDIAVLQITAPPDALVPVSLGDSNNLRVGQRVFAIGNPFGLERTLTVGTLSSLNRTLPSRTGRAMKSILQIDAALNRGSSGGPLLDSRANLIGMNTAIASPTGGSTGVGFAIPVNTIRRVVPQLIANGRVIRPETGITRVQETDRGLIIVSLQNGGPAERAGLRGFRVIKQKERRGPFVYEESRIDRNYADLIVAVDGKRVTSADEFLGMIEAKHSGDIVQLLILREGREIVVPLTLGQSE